MEARVSGLPIAESDVTGLVTDLAAKAPLASPTLTSTPSFPTGTTATTQSAADSSTKLATTAFVTTADNLKANLASPTFTGTVTVPNGSGATDILAYGQVPIPGSLGGPPKIIFRTGDSNTTSNATFVVDDTLLWAVGANDRWLFEGFMTFTAVDGAGAATTADIKMGWTVPASGTMQHGNLATTSSSFGGYGQGLIGQTPVALRTAAQATSSVGAAAATFGYSVSGFYTGGGTAGNVNFEWAQATTNAATLQINKNSIIIAWRIA